MASEELGIGAALQQEAAQGTLNMVYGPQVPSIPAPGNDLASLVASVKALKALADLREGNTGSAMDQHLTMRNLMGEGALSIRIGTNSYSGNANASAIDMGSGWTDPRPFLVIPPALSNFAVQGAFTNVILTWNMMSFANFAYVEVWRGSTNALGSATLLGTSISLIYTDASAVMGTTYYYWIRAIAVGGAQGPYNAVLGTAGGLLLIGNTNLGPLVVQAGNLAAGSIDLTKFGTGLQPITLVTSIPVVYSTNTVFNTVTGLLYQWSGSAYVGLTATSIAAVNITGTLSAAQIASLTAAQITGQITTTQITNNAITTPLISAGAVVSASIAANTIVAGNIAANTITSGQIAANTITATQIAANTITASQIAANTITSSQILANTITAGQILAGTLTATELAAGSVTAVKMAANSIAVGSLAVQNGALVNAMIANATIDSAKIASVNAATITVGAITATQMSVTQLSAIAADMGTISAGNITLNSSGFIRGGQTAYNTGSGFYLGYSSAAYKFSIGSGAAMLTWDGTTLSIPAASVTGTLVASQIATGAITASKIAAGAVTAGTMLLTGQGWELNSDPACVDITAWQATSAYIVVDSTASMGSCFENTAASQTIMSAKFPIDATKNYNVRCSAKQISGASYAYYFVAFYNSSGTVLIGSGWPGSGSYNYYGTSGAQPPGSYTEQSVSFGPNETAQIPAGAVSCTIGALSNYSGSGTQRFASFHVIQKVSNTLVVAGTISTDKIVIGAVSTSIPYSVTNHLWYPPDATTTYSTGAYTLGTIATTGGYVRGAIAGSLRAWAGNQANVYSINVVATFYCDGSQVGSQLHFQMSAAPYTEAALAGCVVGLPFCIDILTQPSATTHTYSVNFDVSYFNNVGTQVTPHRTGCTEYLSLYCDTTLQEVKV